MKRFLFVLLVSVMSCLLLVKGEVNAEDTHFFAEYSGDGYYDDEGEEYIELKYACKLTISLTFTAEASYNGLDVELMEEEEAETVFEKTLRKSGSYQKTITLPAGEYWLSYFADGAFSITLSGEYLPQLSEKEINLELGETRTLKVKGTNEDVVWKSSNRQVASVDNNGVVKGKKIGEATITAECAGYTLSCKVTVGFGAKSYNKLAKKMKLFAKKNKNFRFKTIDVGNKCRLYADKVGFYVDKIDSEGYFMGATYQPYLELVKKGKKAELRLRVEGDIEGVSIYGTNYYCDRFIITTSNRRMNLNMVHLSGKNTYDYSTGVYSGKMKGYATISTSSRVDRENLKKFEKMLVQKSLQMKMTSMDGAWAQAGFHQQTRDNWRGLVKEYQALLK